MSKEDKKAESSAKTEEKKAGGKVLSGVVLSDKMQDTLVVSVTRFVKHPKYRKFVKSMKKYHVHSPDSNVSVGDKVTIRECKPISKTKRFELVNE